MSIKVFVLLLILIAVLGLGDIFSQFQDYYIKKDLIQDTSDAVSRCLNDTYHDYETNSYYAEQDDRMHTVKVADILIEKCEKIKDVMLSIK